MSSLGSLRKSAWPAAILAAIVIAALGAADAPVWVVVAAALAGIGALCGLWAGSMSRFARDWREVDESVNHLVGLVGGLGETETPPASYEPAGKIRWAVGRLKARIHEMSRRLDLLETWLRTATEANLATDAEGIVRLYSPGAERLLGVNAERAEGRPADEVFTQNELLRALDRARQGEPARLQMRVTTHDGPRIWEVTANPVELDHAADQGAPHGVVLSIRDMTESSMALQVKADFVANASHELRTPIAAMRIALDTLDAVGEDDAQMRERLVRVIKTNVGRLEEMVRDLLDLSRLESPDAYTSDEPIHVSDLARDLRETFEYVCAQRRLTLEFDIAPSVELLRTDRRLLQLVLNNLIDNATKYAFEGTPIRIVATPLSSGPGGVRFEVIDRGMGIPLEHQQRIFERYYQVDQARTSGAAKRGTGLGLAIVKHALRRLGGTVRVQSVWQKGTTMVVEIPDCVESTDVAPTGVGAHPPP
jgi:two-component system phosphate regulon sensor histidine kinase PhoR